MPEVVTAPEVRLHVVQSQDALASVLDPNGKLFRDKLAAELFNQKVRRDAKRLLEQEDRNAATGAFNGEMKLIYDPLPTDLPDLLPGLLPESGAAAIVSETNQGKSLLLCEIGSSLLTGTPLWGSIRPNRMVDKIVYVLGEHTAAVIQGLFHHTKLPHTGDFRLIDPAALHPYKALVINGQQQNIAIDRMLSLTEGAGLILFDPLSGFVQGNGAENDNSSMRTLIDVMSYIAEKHHAACLMAAHQGKPKMDEAGHEIRRSVYATRGASAVEDSLTTIFYLKRSISVKQQQHGAERYELITRKRKGVASVDVFKLQRDPETLRHTLLDVKPAGGSYPDRKEVEEYRRRIQRILEANPAFSPDTALKMVSDGEGLAVATLERWLLTA